MVNIKSLDSKVLTRCDDGNPVTEASDIGFSRGENWPFILRAEGLVWTFNRPIVNGAGEDREWAGNIYIALDTKGIRRELTIYND